MRLEKPIQVLHSSLASARFVDMPNVTDKKRKLDSKPFTGQRSNLDEYSKWQAAAYEEFERRPFEYELHVEAMFPQTWGSTALGFGGMGGSAMTDAYTTIIGCVYTNSLAVYFDGLFAYLLDGGICDMERVQADIAAQNMVEVSKKSKYLKR